MADRGRLWGLLIRALVGATGAAILLTAGAQGAAAVTGATQQQGPAAQVKILDFELEGSRFTVTGTAVPETVLRVLTQVTAGAAWKTTARATVGRDGRWTARFHDPTRHGSTKGGRFNILVEQVTPGETVARWQGSVRWEASPEPVDVPSTPAKAPAQPPAQVPVPPASPTPTAAAPAHDPDAPPAGAATSYALRTVNDAGTPARWNPCQPITYFVNPASMPDGAAAVVAEAFSRITALTGIAFADGGSTTTIPWAGGSTMLPLERGPGIYVAFSDPETVPLLAGPVAGYGGHYFTSWPSTDMRIIAGALVIDVSGKFDPGFTTGFGLGAVIEHELGHVMGLGHVDDPTQLMNPVFSRTGPSTFQAGDRAGLLALQAGGCF